MSCADAASATRRSRFDNPLRRAFFSRHLQYTVRQFDTDDETIWSYSLGGPKRRLATSGRQIEDAHAWTNSGENITLTEQGLIQINKGKSKAARRALPLVPAVHGILACRHRDQGCPTEGWVFPTESKSGHLEQGTAKKLHAKRWSVPRYSPLSPMIFVIHH
jgi:hypothetical protein